MQSFNEFLKANAYENIVRKSGYDIEISMAIIKPYLSKNTDKSKYKKQVRAAMHNHIKGKDYESIIWLLKQLKNN